MQSAHTAPPWGHVGAGCREQVCQARSGPARSGCTHTWMATGAGGSRRDCSAAAHQPLLSGVCQCPGVTTTATRGVAHHNRNVFSPRCGGWKPEIRVRAELRSCQRTFLPPPAPGGPGSPQAAPSKVMGPLPCVPHISCSYEDTAFRQLRMNSSRDPQRPFVQMRSNLHVLYFLGDLFIY